MTWGALDSWLGWSGPASQAGESASSTGKIDRLTCNSWPFRGYFDTPGLRQYRNPKYPLLTQLDFPQFLRDHFGLRHVEFLTEHFAETSPGYIHQVRTALRRAGMTVTNIMDVDIPGGLYNPHLNARTAFAYGKLWVDIAHALGSPSITTPLAGSPPYHPATVARNLRPIAAYARRRGIKVLFHNDNIHAESAPQILSVLHHLRAPNAGACPDFGNFAPRSAAYALWTMKQLAPLATNICHAKLGIMNHTILRRDDFAATMAVFRNGHFAGKYSLEFDQTHGDPIAGVRELKEKTMEYL